MPDVMLRYDMRQPDICTASRADMYQAAIEQCAWGEENGFHSVHLSEHHGSEDGYCPSPLVFASAIAARTSSLRLFISALIAPLHHTPTAQCVSAERALNARLQGGCQVPIASYARFSETDPGSIPCPEETASTV